MLKGTNRHMVIVMVGLGNNNISVHCPNLQYVDNLLIYQLEDMIVHDGFSQMIAIPRDKVTSDCIGHKNTYSAIMIMHVYTTIVLQNNHYIF